MFLSSTLWTSVSDTIERSEPFGKYCLKRPWCVRCAREWGSVVVATVPMIAFRVFPLVRRETFPSEPTRQPCDHDQECMMAGSVSLVVRSHAALIAVSCRPVEGDGLRRRERWC
jgi:hypothetical protein